jgi:hypothetical protein
MFPRISNSRTTVANLGDIGDDVGWRVQKSAVCGVGSGDRLENRGIVIRCGGSRSVNALPRVEKRGLQTSLAGLDFDVISLASVD